MTKDCASFTFVRADGKKASVATNGKRHVVQIDDKLESFKTLWKAISSLECRGFRIVTDQVDIF